LIAIFIMTAPLLMTDRDALPAAAGRAGPAVLGSVVREFSIYCTTLFFVLSLLGLCSCDFGFRISDFGTLLAVLEVV